MHDAWAARVWYTRIFAWLLSVMEANAFRAYTKLGDHPKVSHREFTNMLATELMRNPFLGGAAARRSQSQKKKKGQGQGGDASGDEDEDEPLMHEVLRIHEHEQYVDDKVAQRNCNICGRKTKYFCVGCTDQSTTKGGVFLCGSTRQCIPIHIQRRMMHQYMQES